VGPHINGRNFPAGWQKGWARYSSHDPYYRSAWGSDLPVDWDDVKAAAWLTPVQKDSIAYIGDLMGFADGITVPVHLAGGRFAFVSAAARQRSEWRQDRATTERSLLLLSHSFHAAVARKFLQDIELPISPQLKPRELECLLWAARGLSAPETATQIHRSVETVRFHLKNAMGRLGARTIAQAVARAALSGLIDPAAAAND
jgi:DNA-binding CsgD family transcriptional regulator